MNNFYFEIHGDTYLIKIQKSLRKSISLEVIDKYTIEARAPIFVDLETIKNFLRKKEVWLSRNNRKLIEFSEIVPNDPSFPIYILEKPLLIGKDIKVNSLTNYKEETLKWLKENARGLIEREVEAKAKEIGVRYNRIFIKSQKTRWGSCSGRGNLNFNWKIILTTRGCFEYLVIHELCHLIEMNHSYKFWELVRKFDPQYLLHRGKLREYGPLLRL